MKKILLFFFLIIIQWFQFINLFESIEYFNRGGYISLFCINKTDDNIILHKQNSYAVNISCNKMKIVCKSGNFYKCNLPCNFNLTALENNKKIFRLQRFEAPIFAISELEYYQNRSNLTIGVSSKVSISSIRLENYHFNFSDVNVLCRQIWNTDSSIICLLHLKMTCVYYKILNVSILISYGNSSCNERQNLGFILIRCGNLYFIVLICTFLIGMIGIFGTIYVKMYKRKTFSILAEARSVELTVEEMRNIKLQKMAFLDYQTAPDSLSTLTKLNIGILLPLNIFLSRNYKVEVRKADENDSVKDIENLLLNKEKCFKLISNFNENHSFDNKNKCALLITLILFRHPKYFLTIMKELVFKLVSQAKLLSEERNLFTKYDDITEIIIKNWITLCMYYSFKHDEAGKNLFYLIRAIKCKMQLGIIDIYTNKARYCLSYDQLFFESPDYDVLSIDVDVQIQLKLLNSDINSWEINLPNLVVDVLSLDSISQVKGKILDKAIMEYSKLGGIDANDYVIDFGNSNAMLLHLILDSAQVILDDFDQTNVPIKLDKEYIQVNTLQHYQIKNHMKLYFRSNTLDKSIYEVKALPGIQKLTPIHIIQSCDSRCTDSKLRSIGLRVDQSQKIRADLNKESCLMFLLATKKSILPFINGFFQNILNWKSENSVDNSLNSLFGNDYESTSKDLKNSYLNIVYYFFSMLDDIAKQLSVTEETVELWKCKGLILRFWISIISNPNSIFSMDKSEYISDSLVTIWRLLDESSSINSTSVTIHSSIIQQLFYEEIQNKYSAWWRDFVNSKSDVKECKIIEIMNNLIEEEALHSYISKMEKTFILK